MTEKAIFLKPPGGGFNGWIGWEEIINLNIEKDQWEQDMLSIDFMDENKHLQENRIRGLRNIGKDILSTDIAIVDVDKDPKEVIEKIFEYWENYKQQEEQSIKSKTSKQEVYKMLERPKAGEAEGKQVDLIEGLLEAAESKNDCDLRKTIEVKRNGKILFEFSIRPLDKKQIEILRKRYEEEKFNLYKIYLTTIEKEKIWDNEEIQNSLKEKGYSIFTGLDVIQAVLEESEIREINAQIDKISDFHDFEISE